MITNKEIAEWYEPLKGINILDCPEWKTNITRLNTRLRNNELPTTSIKPHIWELVKQMQNRETVFIGWDGDREFAKRGIKINAMTYLLFNWAKEGFFRKPTNIYTSVTTLQNMPATNLLKENYHKYVQETDLLLDIDPLADENPLDDHIQIEAIAITELLDRHNITYSIRISGKGIHIYIKGDQFPHIPRYEKNPAYEEITRNLHEIMGFNHLDLGLYGQEKVTKRICKTPYSIDVKSGYVCLPITKKELIHLSTKLLRPQQILHHRNLYKHGTPLQNQEKTTKAKEFIEAIQPD